MKRNSCCQCHKIIDRMDFFMESKTGKICSDCLLEIKPIQAQKARLFEWRREPEDGNRKAAAVMQLEEAL